MSAIVTEEKCEPVSQPASVFRELGKTLVNVGSLYIPHAHTVGVDPERHLVYFPLQNIDRHPLVRIMEPNSTN